MARRKAMLGPEAEAFSKYEAKLLAQEAAAPREKDESFWMAVTQAGLAAAAGASPHALKNIAEGFGTGLAGYKESLKEFKKAEQERTKALADIEQARRAEKRGDVDAALDRAVAGVPPGADGLLLLPYLAGERTPNVPNGTGVLFGLTGRTIAAGHLARSAMEGVALGLNYGLRRLNELAYDPRRSVSPAAAPSRPRGGRSWPMFLLCPWWR